MDQHIIVVGAGIAGLTAGYRLAQAGFGVTVLEASDHVGGRMSTLVREGYRLDVAASGITTRYKEMMALIDDVGVGSEVVAAPDLVGIVRGGEVHRIHTARAREGLGTKLLSWKAKATAGKILFDLRRIAPTLDSFDLSAAAAHDTESVAAYVDRRLGAELGDYLIDPTIRGLYLGTPDEHSVVDLFFGIMKVFGGAFHNGRLGMDFLCQALAAQLSVELEARVTAVTTTPAGVSVSWSRNGESERTMEASGCVIALSAHLTSALRPDMDREPKALLDTLEYRDLIAVQFGLGRPPAEPAMAIEVPVREDNDLCAVMLDHNKVPGGRAPAGKGLINTYWTADWARRHDDDDDAAVTEAARAAVDRLLPGFVDDIEMSNIARHRPGTLIARPGTYRTRQRFWQLEDPASRVQLAGDWIAGSSTNASLCSGERAARRLRAALTSTRSTVRAGG
jgi:protoporphyrinogen/coproporphyrinogen III oxidase